MNESHPETKIIPDCGTINSPIRINRRFRQDNTKNNDVIFISQGYEHIELRREKLLEFIRALIEISHEN